MTDVVRDPDPTPYAQVPVSRELAELRLQAEEAARAHDDAGLLAVVDRLREQDPQLWPHLWGPACAIAARRTGDPRAWPLLEEALGLGFSQPRLFEGELEEAFAADADWADVLPLLEVGTPPALELLAWPDPAPQHRVVLDRLRPERETVLRERVPATALFTGAWETALGVLEWAHLSWAHANDHVEVADAVDVLDRAAAGRRFACVEYSIVLSQSLNAVGIPARRVQGFQRPHHVGVGRGHVLSEAWIDDLGTWVALDGQNGGYWIDEHERPLGLPELVARHRESRAARMVCLVTPLDERAQEDWFSYFATVGATGFVACPDPYAVSFQGVSVPRAERLTHDLATTHPDLDVVSVGVAGDLARPVLTFATPHPFARGFRIVTDDATVDVEREWPIPATPGEHAATVAVLTPYGAGRPHPLGWRAQLHDQP